VVDRDALIERYRKEIEDLKTRLAEREVEAPVRNRRLSAREVSLFLIFDETAFLLIRLFLLANRRV
jgi:hypothetical protein